MGEAVAAARQINDESERAEVLGELAVRVSAVQSEQVLGEALAAALHHVDEDLDEDEN